MKTALRAASVAGLAALLCGCNPRVRVDPIVVEPIHVTMDINVRLDERLDRFFAFEEEILPGDPELAEEGAAEAEDDPAASSSVEVP